MQKTVQQHFIPKMLLKHFVSDKTDHSNFSEKGKLSYYKYDLVDIKLNHYKQGKGKNYFSWAQFVSYKYPTEVMWKDKFYEIDTLPENTIENRYGEIETLVSPLLDKFLDNVDFTKNVVVIDKNDLEIFIRFMYVQSTRSKCVLDDFDYFEENFSFLVGPNYKERMMLEHSDIFSNMVTNFYNKMSKNCSFVVYTPPKDYHFIIGESATMWMNNYKDLYMPVSPTCCFALITDNGIRNCSIKEMSEDTYFNMLDGFVECSYCLISDMFSPTLLKNICRQKMIKENKISCNYIIKKDC